MSDSKQKNFGQEAEDSARPTERFLATDRDVVPMPVETDAPTAWAEFQMLSTITMKAICDNTEAQSAEAPLAFTSAEVDIELTTESIIEGWTVEQVVALATTDNRVCPKPVEWSHLYVLLLNVTPAGMAFPPQPPIETQFWRTTSVAVKKMCMLSHIEWAEDIGALKLMATFLVDLPGDRWLLDIKNLQLDIGNSVRGNEP